MNPLNIALIFCFLFLPFHSVPIDTLSAAKTITLTADQVSSAIDIETALEQASGGGTHPGVVILDGRNGPFSLTGEDRTINLFHSNLTLLGTHNAIFPALDGIYLDDLPANNLAIQGLTLYCQTDCIGGAGSHDRVSIRGNLLQSGANGITAPAGQQWQINGNLIQAQSTGILLINTRRATISGNHINGTIGAILQGTTFSNIKNNAITNGWQGILVNAAATNNLVSNNSMLGIQEAGIALEPGTTGNTLQGNRVLCAPGAGCLEVDAAPETLAQNRILSAPFRAIRPGPNLVVLTSAEVNSAVDIENAITKATKGGTQPGTLILNGQDGPFTFTGEDLSVNLFYPNLTLRGINHAVIAGCDDGLVIDDVPADHLQVEEITFLCSGDGIESHGPHTDVTLRNNLIQAGAEGIWVENAAGWVVINNLIQAPQDAIRATLANGMTLSGNHLSGFIGVTLVQSTGVTAIHNPIYAAYQGTLLAQQSQANLVIANLILGPTAAGISLEADASNNRVLENWALCTPESTCPTVDATLETLAANTVLGNRP